MNATERLELAREARRLAERELQAERQIKSENEKAHAARVELRRETETLEQKAERLEFQRLQAVYCDCPEMSPDWRDSSSLSQPKAHRGGSVS